MADAVELGHVDFTSALAREEAMGLQNVLRRFEPGVSTALLYLNTDKTPLDDVEVRATSGAW